MLLPGVTERTHPPTSTIMPTCDRLAPPVRVRPRTRTLVRRGCTAIAVAVTATIPLAATGAVAAAPPEPLATSASSTVSTIDAYQRAAVGDQDLCDRQIWIVASPRPPEALDAPAACVPGARRDAGPVPAAATPVDERSPGDPSATSTGGPLAQTDTDVTQLMLGGGLVALAVGTLAALMTRRRPHDLVV